ncbi:MAG TPA: prepilin-type N-terminal cleavage/methylation domain-containing protein, partial [Bryobacteraceae bacterium]|nr:prepilin-type N-terminal cleavage/methylation domain-containing protein [Bryobacteraceae bacterium]
LIGRRRSAWRRWHQRGYRELEESIVERRVHSAGVTLIEMLVVVALIGLVAAVSFPSVTSGIDSIRLRSATDTVVSFLNAGLNKAERQRQPVEITISKADNTLAMRSLDPGFFRSVQMPEGITIVRLWPEIQGLEETSRSFLLYPDGVVPRLGVELANRRGVHRVVRVDPITGVPLVEQMP